MKLEGYPIFILFPDTKNAADSHPFLSATPTPLNIEMGDSPSRRKQGPMVYVRFSSLGDLKFYPYKGAHFGKLPKKLLPSWSQKRGL